MENYQVKKSNSQVGGDIKKKSYFPRKKISRTPSNVQLISNNKVMKTVLLGSTFILLFACGLKPLQESNLTVTPQKQRPISYETGKFFEKNGKQLLYGGDSTEHFDVSNNLLEPRQFHYGIGREAFPALLEPKFTTIDAVDSIWHDTTRFLVAYKGNEIKAYSVKDLTRHEVINDQLDGEPIMAAYCILADLGAIYSRTYGNSTLTFALSGYTYYDPETWNGLDGFVLWDRDTESLWWPLIGQATSGQLTGVKLQELDEQYWTDTTWKQLKRNYPTAQVLISGQDFDRPTTWRQLDETEVKAILISNSGK